MIGEIEKTSCTGCKMCADVCPKQAISYREDQKGFWYPEVDREKCNECGACINNCPGLSGFESTKCHPEVYSAWIADDEIRLTSTSGGVYYALAKQYIKKSDYIAGCRYSENYKGAFHTVTDSEEELGKMVGSKYFQSDTGGIYQEIKTLLDAGKEVLFCGTPCQSAALQRYLKRSSSGLLTVDFICRGVTSPGVYRRYISELEERFQSTVKSVHMKDKRAGWQSLGIHVKFENRKDYYRTGKDDPWVQGYVKENLYVRPSCHYCRYKTLPRVSDISIGDFWGIRGAKNVDLFKGISLVMVNSAKGSALFDQVKDEIIYEKRTLEEAIAGNPSILSNEPVGCKSELFFKSADSMNISEAIKICLKMETGKTPKNIPTMITGKISRFLRGNL